MDVNYCNLTSDKLENYIESLKEQHDSKVCTIKFRLREMLSSAIDLAFFCLFLYGIKLADEYDLIKEYGELFAQRCSSMHTCAALMVLMAGLCLYVWFQLISKCKNVMKSFFLSEYMVAREEADHITRKIYKLRELSLRVNIVDELRMISERNEACPDIYKKDDGFIFFIKANDGFFEERHYIVNEKEELERLMRHNLLDFAYLDETVEEIL